jgi:hypothetical protein
LKPEAGDPVGIDTLGTGHPEPSGATNTSVVLTNGPRSGHRPWRPERACGWRVEVWRVARWVLAPLALLAAVPVAGAQEPLLTAVLRRATAYVDELHEQMSGMVAEERYEQRATGGDVAFWGNAPRRRVLRSDFLLVRPEGEERFYGFRDVFEVDRRTVRDREDRLSRLFLDPSVSSDQQVEGILSDSARYNIGDVERNINTPTYALLFLRSSHKPRFDFTRVFDASPPLGLEAPADTAGVWVLRYEETWPTTLLHGRDGRNLPAEGRFWVEPDTGRVLVSELIIDDPALEATITVRYETDEAMGHLVPVEMRERYDTRKVASRVVGTATYSRFRRFQVQVEEARP